jgi:hypothetical protein
LMCPTSFIASISLSWSGISVDAIAEITTSTCFNAARMLSWSPTSPCKMVFRVGEEDMWQMQGLPSESHAMFDQVHNGNKWIQEPLMDWLTCKMVMPAAVKESSSTFLAELGTAAVSGRTTTKVGCPNRALALAICFPMYPVAPSTKILLFPILARCSQ